MRFEERGIEECRAFGCGGCLVGVGHRVVDRSETRCEKCDRRHVFRVNENGVRVLADRPGVKRVMDYIIVRTVSTLPEDTNFVRALGYKPGDVLYLAEVTPPMPDRHPALTEWTVDKSDALKLKEEDAKFLLSRVDEQYTGLGAFLEHSVEPPLPGAEA